MVSVYRFANFPSEALGFRYINIRVNMYIVPHFYLRLQFQGIFL